MWQIYTDFVLFLLIFNSLLQTIKHCWHLLNLWPIVDDALPTTCCRLDDAFQMIFDACRTEDGKASIKQFYEVRNFNRL